MTQHSELHEHLAAPWGGPSGLRRGAQDPIAVFGASGFIGQHLVRELAARGAPVRAIARRFDAAPDKGNVEHMRADLLDGISVAQSLRGVSTVVQLANNINPASGNNRLVNDLEQEVVTQIRFLEACVAAGVKRVVFPSSGGAVYGNPRYSPLDENHPVAPISSYGVTKMAVERYLHLFQIAHGLDYVVLRISNPYGPGQAFRRGQGLIPQVIEKIRTGEPATVFGEGEATRDFLYIGDLARGMADAVMAPEAANRTINLASGQSSSVMQIMTLMSDLLGYDIPLRKVPARNSDVTDNRLDIRLASELLRWTPQVSLREGMTRTLEAAGLLGQPRPKLMVAE